MVSACLWWRAESLVSRGDWQDGFVSGEILCSTVGSGGLQSIEHHMANVLLEYMPLSLSRCFCHAVLKNVSHAYFLFFIYTICSMLDKIVSKLVCNCFLWIIAIRLHITSFLGWGRFIKLQEKRFLSYRFTQSSELYRIQEKYCLHFSTQHFLNDFSSTDLLRCDLQTWQLQKLSYISILGCAENSFLCAYSLGSMVMFPHTVNASQK